jgi:hypothetical protein
MAANGQTSWHVKGEQVANCTCQFNALPTHGNCMAMIAWEVGEGKFGDTDLDGVRWAMLVRWPGAIHEGDGTRQLIVDEGASDEQRSAIEALFDAEHGGDYWEIFKSVCPHEFDPASARIEFVVDRESRKGTVRIGDLAEAKIEPIRNPVTDEEHRVRIDIPDGFEYEIAEVGNTVEARISSQEPLSFTLENTYAQLNEFDWSNA